MRMQRHRFFLLATCACVRDRGRTRVEVSLYRDAFDPLRFSVHVTKLASCISDAEELCGLPTPSFEKWQLSQRVQDWRGRFFSRMRRLHQMRLGMISDWHAGGP